MREIQNFNQKNEFNKKSSHTKIISKRNKAKTIGKNI